MHSFLAVAHKLLLWRSNSAIITLVRTKHATFIIIDSWSFLFVDFVLARSFFLSFSVCLSIPAS